MHACIAQRVISINANELFQGEVHHDASDSYQVEVQIWVVPQNYQFVSCLAVEPPSI
jgi:hypothetical protein